MNTSNVSIFCIWEEFCIKKKHKSETTLDTFLLKMPNMNRPINNTPLAGSTYRQQMNRRPTNMSQAPSELGSITSRNSRQSGEERIRRLEGVVREIQMKLNEMIQSFNDLADAVDRLAVDGGQF